jgi:hypothetical protein
MTLLKEFYKGASPLEINENQQSLLDQIEI